MNTNLNAKGGDLLPALPDCVVTSQMKMCFISPDCKGSDLLIWVCFGSYSPIWVHTFGLR